MEKQNKKRITYVGEKYENLTVLSQIPERINNRIYWKCQCDCGNEIEVAGTELRIGRRTACPECLKKKNDKTINELGKVYGDLTVIEKMGPGTSIGKTTRNIYWKCRCKCGNEIIKEGRSLRKGMALNCGECSEIGKTYGYLTVLSFEKTEGGEKIWRCKCTQCNNEILKTTNELHRGINILSCGCIGAWNRIDMTGWVMAEHGVPYSLLTVIKAMPSEKNKSKWLCRCSCGNEFTTGGVEIRAGKVISCGCIKSKGEREIIDLLQKNQIDYCYQYYIKIHDKKNYSYDFAIIGNDDKILRFIEFDGEQHFASFIDRIDTWTNNQKSFEEIQRRDQLKNEYAKLHNIPLVRIPYWQRGKITIDMLMSDKYLVK